MDALFLFQSAANLNQERRGCKRQSLSCTTLGSRTCRDMPSFDLSSPLSKKRKITTTDGSQGYVTRALRAVRNAVPANLISLGNSYDDHSIQSTGSEQNGDTITNIIANGVSGEIIPQDQSDSPHGILHSDRTLDEQDGDRPIPKRLQNVDSPIDTPSRKKRRKNNNSSGLEDPDEGQTSEVHDNPAIGLSGISNTQQSSHTLKHWEGDDATSSGNNAHIDGGRSTGRSRRPPRRYSPEMDDRSPKVSTTLNQSTLKTPPSTLSRKRGRPRKQPIITPTAGDEERELGFHEINSKDTLSTYNQDKNQRGHRKTPKQTLLNGKGSSPTSGHHVPGFDDEDRNINEFLGQEEETHQPVNAQASGTQVGEPKDVTHGKEHRADDDMEQQKDLEVPQKLQRSISKLQRLLKATPIHSVNLFKSDLAQGLVSGGPLVHLDDEYRKVQQLVTQTVLAGEGNSMIIVGPRGCGKTALVETVLADLAKDHHEDFITVRLNGFIHTDDKLALREIWRQLGREVAAEEDTGPVRTNYADTLTSLLALLAHSGEEEGQEEQIARSVIFVIDEFDLFATHPRQTLLYNLFDVAQSRNAPIAVLGLTTRIDIVESLEKRVKSRFGQRYVYLAHPKTFSTFQNLCKSVLTSREPEAQTLSDRVERQRPEAQKLRTAWNEYLDALFTHDKQFESYLRYLFAQNKSISSFQSASLLRISLLSASSILNGASVIRTSLLPSDSKLQLLPSLADLELSLIIAAARLDVILDTDVCNFSMVYEEYVQLASRVKVQSSAAGQTAVGGGARVWGKEVALGSWEKLIELGLIIPAGMGMGGDGNGGMYRVDVALEEIGPSCPKMGSTMSKWCREI